MFFNKFYLLFYIQVCTFLWWLKIFVTPNSPNTAQHKFNLRENDLYTRHAVRSQYEWWSTHTRHMNEIVTGKYRRILSVKPKIYCMWNQSDSNLYILKTWTFVIQHRWGTFRGKTFVITWQQKKNIRATNGIEILHLCFCPGDPECNATGMRKGLFSSKCLRDYILPSSKTITRISFINVKENWSLKA
jgi:hypothetical protein